MKKIFFFFLVISFLFAQKIYSQTTIILQPGPEGKDAQLWSIMPDLNIGTSPKFLCSGWTHNGEPGINRGIIDFDFSQIPENAQILEAKVSFYFVCLEPTFFGHTGDNDAFLQLITEPWEEEYVTWNEQPATTEFEQVYLPPSTDPYQDYTDIDVTTLIRKLYTEPENYHGIMLKLINEYPYNCLLFASGDYSDTVEFRPRLEVTYTLAPAYTVEIQPGPEGKDAQLWTIMPDNNYGDIPKFDCSGWTHYGVPGVNRGIIDFDLSLIPEGAVITDARLNLYFVCLEPTYFGHTGNNDAYLQLITGPWEEDNVTWNTQPMTTENDQVYLPPSTDPYQDYTDIDITGLIQNLYTDTVNYHGIMLRLLDEDPYRCLLFASGDYTDTIEYRPKLVITYTFCEAPVTGFTYISEGLTYYFEDTTSSADGRYWDFGDGYYSDLINPWHTYDYPGEHTVCLMTWNGCGSDTLCKTISNLLQDVKENAPDIISVYPNPAGDYFTLSSSIEGQAELAVFDLSSREMLNQQVDFLSGKSGRINTEKLPSGIYFARITSGRITGTVKIIVKH